MQIFGQESTEYAYPTIRNYGETSRVVPKKFCFLIRIILRYMYMYFTNLNTDFVASES